MSNLLIFHVFICLLCPTPIPKLEGGQEFLLTAMPITMPGTQGVLNKH